MTRGAPRRRSHPANLRPTLTDVAREAGVSVMTVSNFVRGKPVRVETRKTVGDAIARLNYRPNLSARSLRLSEEFSVGAVIAEKNPAFLNDPFISRLVSGLSNFLSNLDYTLDLQGVDPGRFENATILRKIGNAALCAILCGPKTQRREHIEKLRKLDQPVVVFQETFQSPSDNVAIISQNDLSGGRQLAEHLLQKSIGTVWFVRPALQWCAVEQREKGLRETFEKRKKPVQFTAMTAESERFEDVEKVVAEGLATSVPDAIVGATDSMAVAALKACERANLQVPSDLLVAGFNGFDACRYTSPTLTTIVSPAYDLGRCAGEVLIQRLRTGSFPRRSLVLPVHLQVADSTGGPSTRPVTASRSERPHPRP